MKISTKFDFKKIPHRKKSVVRLMISAESKKISTKNSKSLNLALVLDRSGSMGGNKIRNVREATKILTDRMGQDDLFSLTVFDSNIDTLVTPVKIGSANGIEQIIDGIDTGDTTNLSDGYLQGCEHAKQNKGDQNVTRVILLTDGLANRGITDPDHLADLTSTMQIKGISTTTIGVGEDYDEFLLGKMAENGGGGAYFIEKPDDAQSVFEEELGYMQSLVASDLKLKFIPAKKKISFNQLNTYKVFETNNYLLGDVYGGQLKRLILEINLPEMEKKDGVEIGYIEASYRDAVDKESPFKTFKIPINVDVVGREEFLKVVPEKDVIVNSAYLTVARAKTEAIKLADRRKFKEAANLLENFADEIERLTKKYQLDDSRLSNDIRELRNRAKELRSRGDRYYTRIERKRMYHESDMLMKSKVSSYDAMMDRRTRYNRGTFEYPCYNLDGHIVSEIDNDRVLIVAGSPTSIGFGHTYTLGDRNFPLQQKGFGLDIDEYSQLIGTGISILLGADILNVFDYIIDLKKEKFIISFDSINYNGDVLKSTYFRGIPIIPVEIDNQYHKMFFDTGSRVPFLKADMLSGYPAVGQDTDFFPGFGEFRTDIYSMRINIAGHEVKQLIGALPETLEKSLSFAGVDGIIGTSIFDNFNVCHSARDKKFFFKRYKRN